jgi:hypothetical protein
VSEDRKRRRGLITSAAVTYNGDHLYWTCRVDVDYDVLDASFGNLVLDEAQARAFAAELCATFAVVDLNALVGRFCWGLWCFGENNEEAEGLEAPSGRRFTLTAFRRKHFPNLPSSSSSLERKRAEIEGAIRHLQRRLGEEQVRLKTLDERWTDWEAQAPPTAQVEA